MPAMQLLAVYMMNDGLTVVVPKGKPCPTFWAGARFVGYTQLPLYDEAGQLLSINEQEEAWRG